MEFDFRAVHGLRLVDVTFGADALSVAELRSLIVHLPDDSAFGRALGRVPIAALSLVLQHGTLDVLVAMATQGRHHAPPLDEIVTGATGPTSAGSAPVKPRTMTDWITALGPLAEGVPTPEGGAHG